MPKDEQRDWLDDAFNDEKAQADMQSAKRSRNVGCLIATLVMIVGLVVLSVVMVSMVGSLLEI